MITFRGETDVDKGFRAYLADAGLQVRYTVRDLNQDMAHMPAIVREARALAPDLIYVWGTPAALALVGPYDEPDNAQRYIRDIPVVFALVAAPVQSRLVARLDAPGRNCTGAVHVVPPEVQLRVMQNYLAYRKVGVLYNAGEPNSQAIVAQARAWCAGNGAQLIERTFHTNAAGQPVADGVEELVGQIHAAGAQWLYLLPDTFLGQHYARVTPAAQQLRLPTFGAAELAVRSGGALLGLVSRYWSVGQLAAAKAQDILVGGKSAAEIPVETLKRFSLLVNMRVARGLHLYPPIDMLNYAEVIAVGDGPALAS
ncbi:ABC transporter substrate-binding protein [Melaminivora sp.]